MEQIIYGNIRVQLLSEDIIRLEKSKGGKFCDRNTFFIPNKSEYAQTRAAYSVDNGAIYFGKYALFIPEDGKSLSGVRLEKNGKKVYSYKKLANCGELPPLNKTPEVFAVADTPRIIVPEGGYSVNRKGRYKIEENVKDVYLLLCDKNAEKLRKLYVELCGRSELVRLATLGSWNSKYYAYDEETAKELILDYEAHRVPLDNMVIDTDWRNSKDGWGYDVNTELFPDIGRFLEFSHAHGVEIMFNDHPEPVDGANVFDSKEIAYREVNLQAKTALGLDTWWYDRNWTSSLVSPSKNIRPETLGLYLYTDITGNFYKKQAKNDLVYRRPVIMGNVVNVENGRYEKISDSASHRYPIQWTGDITGDFNSLAQEVETMLRASDSVVAYCNADCGGHYGTPDKQTFIRWMQFGTLSPVFRPHCTKGLYREPWLYDEETLNIVRDYVNLRYRLLPVIYKNAYENYLVGTPIFKSLGWSYPSDKRALTLKDEYMLGNDILIKPIASASVDPDRESAEDTVGSDFKTAVYLPDGEWLDAFDGKIYSGNKTIKKAYGLRQIPLFIRLGSLVPLAYEAGNTKKQKWNKLVYDFYPEKGSSDEGYLYEDDGETTAYKLGRLRKSAFEAKYCENKNAYVIKLHAAQGSFDGERAFTERDLTIKYHLLKGAQSVKKVTVNGEQIKYKIVAADKKAFPLGVTEISPDGKVVSVKITADVNKDYEIIFYTGE